MANLRRHNTDDNILIVIITTVSGTGATGARNKSIYIIIAIAITRPSPVEVVLPRRSRVVVAVADKAVTAFIVCTGIHDRTGCIQLRFEVVMPSSIINRTIAIASGTRVALDS